MHRHCEGLFRLRSGQLFLSRYLVGWSFVAVIVAADWSWLSASGYSVREGVIVSIMKTAGFVICSAACLFALARIPRYALLTEKLRCQEIAHTLAWLTLLLCFVASGDVLQYLCVTVNAPLVDERLIRIDSALGFHWLVFYRWIHSHQLIQSVLDLAYRSGVLQLLAVPIILGITGRRDELSEFMLLVILSTVFLLLISTPIPASSAFLHFGITDPYTSSAVSDFYLLRNGTLRVFNLLPSQGLVSMPSFHTTLAIFFVYALRRVPMLFPLSVLLNLTMILSTPTQGGHYLADLFAGLMLSALTIFILRKFFRLVTFRTLSEARTDIACEESADERPALG